MHRRDIAAAVSARSGLKLDLVDSVLVEALDVLGGVLTDRRRVSLRGFGVFEPRDRAATTRRKPDTQELIDVPPSVAVGFRPSPTLKRRMMGEDPDGDDT